MGVPNGPRGPLRQGDMHDVPFLKDEKMKWGEAARGTLVSTLTDCFCGMRRYAAWATKGSVPPRSYAARWYARICGSE